MMFMLRKIDGSPMTLSQSPSMPSTVLAAASLPLLDNDVLRTFVAISEVGSFTAAADMVFRTPSAVSMQIKKLEDQLGVSLFRRDARSVTLTPHGALLVSYAKRILALNNEAVARFLAPEMNGVVRLGSPDDIGELILPGILTHLARTWPHLAIEVTIAGSVELRKAVNEKRLDVTLFNFLNGIAADPTMTVMSEKLVWAGKKHGQAHLKTPLPLSVWDESCVWRKRAMTELTRQGKEFRIAYFCGHHVGQYAAIRADIAVAPLARFLLQDDMVELTEQDGMPDLGSYEVGLAVCEDASPPVKAVADYVRCVLGNRGCVGTAVAA
ncbi:LysR family transcriptional regulator [Agrobacterium vitis]|uniref:HTH-type transcriptional regulator TtuA n=2 Tax=Agrobacterium vitis TaxID=373 RepID=A0A6A9UCU6_AGRVI|nr:LysR family transcriptional regulator [Agrobacterium vitis]MVA33798.1 LysR family transcriptional regulator [Agrobacterium vitis]MVA55539.1 LysR family transcriptional regulator [Agrobacterium vitis]